MQWINVKDGLPSPNEDVLLFREGGSRLVAGGEEHLRIFLMGCWNDKTEKWDSVLGDPFFGWPGPEVPPEEYTYTLEEIKWWCYLNAPREKVGEDTQSLLRFREELAQLRMRLLRLEDKFLKYED